MRTRRSWRNQERLWRELGEGDMIRPARAPTPPDPAAMARLDAWWTENKDAIMRDVAKRRAKEAKAERDFERRAS